MTGVVKGNKIALPLDKPTEDTQLLGKIAANEKVSIKCENGHIRYDYAVDSEQPYEGDVSVLCDDDRGDPAPIEWY